MTDDRIKAAEEEIQKDLKPKPEYVVSTSEFNDVKARLAMLHSRRKLDTNSDPNQPKLQRAPGTTDPVDNGITNTDTDERPTLKRRDTRGGN
jgi:hypothetical protein